MTPHPGRETPGPERPPLTPAQHRALTGADPGTGEVRAGAATLARLVALGLARPYGRLGAHYLTAAGRTHRERLQSAETTETATPDGPRFSPATGDGPPHPGLGRAEAVEQAWHSLREIRRLTGPRRDQGATDEPAAWERARPAHAVALALEASGTPPSAQDRSGRRIRTGYRVAPDAEPGSVRVEWRTTPDADHDDGHEGLDTCARVLAGCGWEAERYTDSRRRPYLVVAPRPAR